MKIGAARFLAECLCFARNKAMWAIFSSQLYFLPELFELYKLNIVVLCLTASQQMKAIAFLSPSCQGIRELSAVVYLELIKSLLLRISLEGLGFGTGFIWPYARFMVLFMIFIDAQQSVFCNTFEKLNNLLCCHPTEVRAGWSLWQWKWRVTAWALAGSRWSLTTAGKSKRENNRSNINRSWKQILKSLGKHRHLVS